jgi:toxin ParE1/3/4
VKVLLTVEAEEELMGAARFYSTQASAALGLAFVEEVERACRLLLEQPSIGVVWHGQTRRLALRRFPFNLIYQIHADEIRVIAIAHQRRKPGYWMT